MASAHANFPKPTASFIGRPERVAEAAARLGLAPVVTIAGPGGTGKTRLAIRLAETVSDSFPDGMWFVDLTPVRDPAFVTSTVADVLGVREDPSRPLADTLCEALDGKRALLVLDNCEHVVGACAMLVRSLPVALEGARILATSRVVLGLSHEVVYQVPLLDVPREALYLAVEEAAETEAVQLFVQRATLADPTFALTDENVEAVAEICRRVEGLPLAVELAAARARTHEPAWIASLLRDRFVGLDAEDPEAPLRHRTLRATVDWSYDLLNPDEQALLRHLSVFVGGWTLDAAEAVAVGPPAPQRRTAGNLLERLVDKSFVTAERGEAGTRYGMLETIRQYARDRLRAEGEEEWVLRAHGLWYLSLAEQVRRQISASPRTGIYAILDPEHDNLRAALRRGLRDAGFADECLRGVAALYTFWNVRGHYMEGLRWIDEALAKEGPTQPASRAGALHGKALLSQVCGEYAVAAAAAEECIALRREIGDLRGVALAMNLWAMTLNGLGEVDRAREVQEECLALARDIGDSYVANLAVSSLGIMAMGRGDLDVARGYIEEALAGHREAGNDMMVAVALFNLGLLTWAEENFDTAAGRLEESLVLARGCDYKRLVADNLTYLGRVYAERGDLAGAIPPLEEAMRLQRGMGNQEGVLEVIEAYGLVLATADVPRKAALLYDAATAIRRRRGMERSPLIERRLDRKFAATYAALLDVERRRQAAHANAMELDEAVALALDSGKLLLARLS